MTQPARTTTFQAATARVRTRMPLVKRWSVPFRKPGGGVGYAEVIWMTAARWKTTEEAKDPAWQSLPVAGFVIALRLLF